MPLTRPISSRADVIANPETYLFWLAFPSMIYIVARGRGQSDFESEQSQFSETYRAPQEARAAHP